MGRTLPTVNQVLEQNREQWARFYRALRKEDRALLDRLFDGAKYFTAACVYQANVTPSESIILAMLLHLEKELTTLQHRLAAEERMGHRMGQSEEQRAALGEESAPRVRVSAAPRRERLLLAAGEE